MPMLASPLDALLGKLIWVIFQHVGVDPYSLKTIDNQGEDELPFLPISIIVPPRSVILM